jgi:hypothetical protein
MIISESPVPPGTDEGQGAHRQGKAASQFQGDSPVNKNQSLYQIRPSPGGLLNHRAAHGTSRQHRGPGGIYIRGLKQAQHRLAMPGEVYLPRRGGAAKARQIRGQDPQARRGQGRQNTPPCIGLVPQSVNQNYCALSGETGKIPARVEKKESFPLTLNMEPPSHESEIRPGLHGVGRIFKRDNNAFFSLLFYHHKSRPLKASAKHGESRFKSTIKRVLKTRVRFLERAGIRRL